MTTVTAIAMSAATTTDLAGSLPALPVGYRWVIKPTIDDTVKVRLEKYKARWYGERWVVDTSQKVTDGYGSVPTSKHSLRNLTIKTAEDLWANYKERQEKTGFIEDMVGVYEPRKV